MDPVGSARGLGWANLITLGRGVLTLVVWVLVAAAEGRGSSCWWVAFAAFLLTALTDVLDGAVARRLGEVSVLGRIADPLVDKLLVVGTMVVLLGVPGVRDALPPWVVLLVLARELIVTALRAEVEAGGGSFQAAFWGKAKMLAQCVALAVVLAHQAGVAWLDVGVPGLPVSWVQLVVLLAALLTALSLGDYLRRAVGLLRGS